MLLSPRCKETEMKGGKKNKSSNQLHDEYHIQWKWSKLNVKMERYLFCDMAHDKKSTV